MGLRCIFKVKHVEDGSIEKYKARIVAKGFSHIEGGHYKENFALVSKYPSIGSILSSAMQMGWKIHQMNVKTTFLIGVVEEEIYIKNP